MAQQLARAALDWMDPLGTLLAVIDAELLPHRWSSRTQPVAAPLVRGPSADVDPLPVIPFSRCGEAFTISQSKTSRQSKLDEDRIHDLSLFIFQRHSEF